MRDPASGGYSIADTGELVLGDPKLIDKLMAARPLRESDAEGVSPLLKGGGLLRRVREVMDEEIVGEYENKLPLFLLMLSKDLGPEYSQACFIMGSSGSGKSYLMHKVLSYFPEDCVIWITRTTAHGLEYFCKGKDLNGKILAVEEAPGVGEAQQA